MVCVCGTLLFLVYMQVEHIYIYIHHLFCINKTVSHILTVPLHLGQQYGNMVWLLSFDVFPRHIHGSTWCS